MSELHKLSKKSSNFSIAAILADNSSKSSQLWSIHLIKMNSIQDKILSEDIHNNSCFDQHSCNVLSVDFTKKCQFDEIYSSSRNVKSYEKCDELSSKRKVTKSDFSWLQCTRYQPPKIPKKNVNSRVCKRKPAKHPRIPFTSFQLEILEEKFKRNAYLLKKDVIQLSATLRLPHSRIKIWFQNRRARDRKEIKVSSSFPNT